MQGTVRQRTCERYESIVRVHIKPSIGRVKLKALTPAHARALYRQKLDAGLSPRTVNYIHVTLHKALKDATSDGLVRKNVAAAVKSPRPEKPEIHPLTREQARVLLDLASRDGNRFEALYVVAIHCGLREGELLGLKWADVDLETGTLQVRRTLSGTRTGHIFEKPKNGKGRSVKCSQKATEGRCPRAASPRSSSTSSPSWTCSRYLSCRAVNAPGLGANPSGPTRRHDRPMNALAD